MRTDQVSRVFPMCVETTADSARRQEFPIADRVWPDSCEYDMRAD